MADEQRQIELCKTAEVAPGTVIRIEAGGLELAVYNNAGEYYVTDDACTHGPALLSEGRLEGYVIECDFHQGGFDIRTGEVVQPPCMIDLKTYPVTVQNDTITITA